MCLTLNAKLIINLFFISKECILPCPVNRCLLKEHSSTNQSYKVGNLYLRIRLNPPETFIKLYQNFAFSP